MDLVKKVKQCDCHACTLTRNNYGYQPCLYLRPGVQQLPKPKPKDPLEKEVEKRFHRKLCAIGAFTWKFASENTRGVSDRIVLYHGRVIFVELKRTKGKMTDLQVSFQGKVLDHEGEFACVYGYAGTDEFIKQLQAGDSVWRNFFQAGFNLIKRFIGDIR